MPSVTVSDRELIVDQATLMTTPLTIEARYNDAELYTTEDASGPGLSLREGDQRSTDRFMSWMDLINPDSHTTNINGLYAEPAVDGQTVEIAILKGVSLDGYPTHRANRPVDRARRQSGNARSTITHLEPTISAGAIETLINTSFDGLAYVTDMSVWSRDNHGQDMTAVIDDGGGGGTHELPVDELPHMEPFPVADGNSLVIEVREESGSDATNVFVSITLYESGGASTENFHLL